MEQSRTATDSERRAKALAGRRRLLARFTWKHVAARLGVLALQAQTRSQLSPTGSKVAWLSTYNVHCGIAGHVEHLLAPIPPDDVLILAGIQEPRVNPIDPPNCFRCWILNKDNNNWGDVRAIVDSNNVHAIIIQHSYGFFNHAELSSFMNECINMGVAVILELHTTVDPLGDTENFRIADLLGVLHRCHRIIVHSPVDADRLKSLGVVRNVTVLTLGVMRPQSDANRSGLQTPPLIASFGFSFPNKGLVELVQAVGILRDAGRPIRLRMLNAQSPNPISEVVVRDIQKTIKDLDLENVIEFRFDYLEDAVFIPLLSEADLIVNPYQQTGESASAAVRHELATGRPVAVTPLTIFDELGDAVFRLPGITPQQLADGIDEVLRHIASQSDTAQRVRTAMDQWIDQHDYAKHSKLYMALARSASLVGAATPVQTAEEMQSAEPVASAGPKRPRGAFINTAAANCSIFESGKMVYGCIQQSPDYDLDYYALDLIDVGLFVRDQKLRICGENFERKSSDYDFWVFNWHFITMAPHIPNDTIRGLPGPKFSVVLELEPDNPLAFIPPDVFDGFIALDPTAPPVDNIYPFPRPLEGDPRTPSDRSSKAPVIGSFGYGTPGKGFGLLVEAVNREFAEATVRINVPPGTYTASMDRIHLRDYPTYLADLCRRIAKPGIKVEFTNEFMTQEALVEWCAANDLNCFMYTRRQSGLSATTDQAIMSGQPLLTSSNDTFRHIHKFIPPYPIMGLKAAIETTTPLVRIMQADWSKTAFVGAFHNMLRDFSVLTADSLPKAGPGGRLGPLGRKLVVASPRETHPGDILRHAKRVADALGRSGEYEISRLQYDSVAELEGQIGADVEAVILDAATLDTKAAAVALNRFQGVKIFMTNDRDPRASANATFLEIPRPPVIPFFTARSDLKAQWPSIWLIGFAAHDSNLEDIVSKILREAPDAELLFEAPSVDREAFQARIERLPFHPGKFSIELAPTEGGALISRLSEDHLSVFYHDPARLEELLDMCSLALTTERAVTFTRAAPFAAFKNGATYIEDFATSELIAMGMSAQISLYHDLGEWQIFAKLHGLLSDAFHDRAMPQSAVG